MKIEKYMAHRPYVFSPQTDLLRWFPGFWILGFSPPKKSLKLKSTREESNRKYIQDAAGSWVFSTEKLVRKMVGDGCWRNWILFRE